ncbi:MAG TPA: VWA domain-containing protein [Vicinamibacterales bacterium]|nr:VWA domain-containing protein [Vicinamibacterales bacterium]
MRGMAVDLFGDWRLLRPGDLQFWHRDDARLLLVSLAVAAGIVLVARFAVPRRQGRYAVAVPALLASVPRRVSASLTHLPLLIAIAGLPFLAVALADPYTSLVRSEATYPGRRICLMIDASNSMSSPFKIDKLPQRSDGESNAFITTVAAAEQFVQMRRSGPYRDLLALVEFGADAYVVTPFTNDYDNLLVSLSLIGEPHEFATFPDQRTLIARGIDEAVALFRAFKYLDASGNLLLIFSDGEDTNAMVNGRSLDDIIRGAVDAGVPVYLVRTNYNKAEGDPAVPDKLWSEAVRRTGGRFFAASDERSLLAAINEIDKVAAGNIQVTEYNTARPRFPMFASVAAACFALGALSKLGVPFFQRYP